MSRRYPPAPISPPPVAEPFPIGNREKVDLAKVLGLERLPAELCDAISQAIGCYQATKAGSADTTVKSVLAALGELSKSGRVYDKAVKRLADDRSGVDYTTHEMLPAISQSGARGRTQFPRSSRPSSSQASGRATSAPQTRCSFDRVPTLFLRRSTLNLQSIRLSRAKRRLRRELASMSQIRHRGIHDRRHRPC